MSIVLDVKCAYLKSPIKEEYNENLYIRLPNGNIHKLTKYLYGLKQAGKEWNDNITNTLISNGYLPTEDASVFYRKENVDFILMSIHVDDFYVISTKQAMLDILYNELIIKYKDVSRKSGNELSCLGFVIKRDNHNHHLQITQPTYFDKILKEASMEQCNGISTPMSISVDNEDINDNYEYVDKQYYPKLVGLINYLAINTRPDLLYSLSQVAQRCTKPTTNDLQRVNRILRYISATKDLGLTYRCDNDFRLICHVDSSYNSYTDGKSHYGLTFSLGESNGSFYAKSCICLSSAEAEYVAVSKASTEIIYLRRLLHSLGWSQS